jgi:hypothetical protein
MHTNAYKVLVGNCEERRPLGRPTSRWEDNIYFKGKRLEVVDGISWVQTGKNGDIF